MRLGFFPVDLQAAVLRLHFSKPATCWASSRPVFQQPAADWAYIQSRPESQLQACSLTLGCLQHPFSRAQFQAAGLSLQNSQHNRAKLQPFFDPITRLRPPLRGVVDMEA